MPTEGPSECESGAASTSKVVVEEGAVGGKEEPTRPKTLDLLPPPPRKEGKRSPQVNVWLEEQNVGSTFSGQNPESHITTLPERMNTLFKDFTRILLRRRLL